MRAKPKKSKLTAPPVKPEPWPHIFAALFGAFLGLGLIKFGNPIILDRLISEPPEALASVEHGFAANPALLAVPEGASDWSEIIYRPWSMIRGLWILGGLTLLGLKVGRWRPPVPRWLFSLPVFWLAWQLMAASQTINKELSHLTLLHFFACVLCFFLGWHSLSRARTLAPFWAGLIAGLALVFWQGFSQHYGGLEALQRFIYEQPNWREFSPEALKRFTSGRIFSTLVYPNALAGAILLLLPPAAVALWRISQRLTNVARGALVGTLVYSGLACLLWSGSKAGWLIGLGLGLVTLLSLPLARRLKWMVLSGVLVFGLGAFSVRYAGYFARGAPSVSARFDYWQAALQTAWSHPLLGTGPGTFSVAYKKIKGPESEMARLAHNDYLEQASDSGFAGFLAYIAFIGGTLVFLYRYSPVNHCRLCFAIWLGLLGWAVQGLVEFGLYIPALAWPAFTLMGWMLGKVPEIGSTQ